MDIRKVREEFGRVKPYYLRNETLRALASAITAFHELGGTPPPTDLRGNIREAIQLLAKDPLVKENLMAPLSYNPGQEKLVYAQLIMAYKGLKAKAEQEDREVTLARKLRLDKAYNEGIKLLGQGNVSDADASFSEAVSNYKDEHRIFYLIGSALLEAGEVRRAYPYLKRGAEVAPHMEDMAELFEKAAKMREELQAKS